MKNYIESTYYSLERTSHEQNFNTLVAGLHEYFNLPQFAFSEVFGYKYTRGLFAACANIDTLERMVDKQVRDLDKPVFLSHMLLIKASTLDDMTDYLPIIVKLIQQQRLDNVGTTLGQAIGYLTGLGIRRGQNVGSLVGLYSAQFIEDSDYFLKGFKEGLNSSSSLVSRNSTYMLNLLERYDEWDAASVKVIIRVFQNLTKRTLEEGYSKDNERILWVLQGLYYTNKTIQNLYHVHSELENDMTPEKKEIGMKEAVKVEPEEEEIKKVTEEYKSIENNEKPSVSKKDYSTFL